MIQKSNSSNTAYVVIGIFIFIVFILSIIALIYTFQVNNNLTNANDEINNIDTDITAISYNNSLTTIDSNLKVNGTISTNGAIISNGIALDKELSNLINQMTSLQNKIKPYIANQTIDRLNILTPTSFEEIITGNLVIKGPIWFNDIDISNNLSELQNIFNNSVDKDIFDINRTLKTKSIITNNFSCDNFFGGIKAYITCVPSSSTKIKLNNGCTFSYLSPGTYTITINSNINGILGLPICTTDQYTTYVSQTNVYVYTIYVKEGGTSPESKDPTFLCFMLI